MPTRHNRNAEPAQGQAKASHARLEQQREWLQQRMDRLRPVTKASTGYKTARALLGSKYLRSSLAARVAILQAANFLISVLEMTPPPPM